MQAALPQVLELIPAPLGPLVRAARPAGVPLHVWTVNDAPTAHALWQLGARGIISDDPAVILRARDAWDARAGTST